MLGYLNVFGPNKDLFHFVHGMGLLAHQKFRKTPPWTMKVGVKYHIRYCYDTKKKVIDVHVTEGGKTAVQSFDAPNVQAIFVGAADFFRMDLGFELGVNDKEPRASAPEARVGST